MKFIYPYINETVNFDCDFVNSIIIENKKLFRTLVEDISLQIDGLPGKSILSVDDEPIEMYKAAEIISEFAPFNINKKSILSKINQALEKEALREDHYMITMDIIGKIEKYIADISFDCPCDIVCTKLSAGNIIKAAGVEISDDNEKDIDRIFDYITLVSEFDKSKLFIMINMRSYFDDDEMEQFCATVLEHDIKMLLIDNKENRKLSSEKRLLIDDDLCEI